MVFTSPLYVAFADLEHRDVRTLCPIPCPLDKNGSERPRPFVEAFRKIDAILIDKAAAFRAAHDAVEVADRLADLKLRKPHLGWLIGENQQLLEALCGDPRPFIAGKMHAAQTEAFWKVVIADWIDAHRAEVGEAIEIGRAA